MPKKKKKPQTKSLKRIKRIPLWAVAAVEISFLRTKCSSSSNSSSIAALPLADFIISMKLWLLCPDGLFKITRFPATNYIYLYSTVSLQSILMEEIILSRLTEMKRESWSCHGDCSKMTVSASPTTNPTVQLSPPHHLSERHQIRHHEFHASSFLFICFLSFFLLGG